MKTGSPRRQYYSDVNPQCFTRVQDAAMGDEEEQVLALLLSKGAAESALADEMGRLKVQEEVGCSQIKFKTSTTVQAYLRCPLNCDPFC